ncbi:hypothetical protein F9C07_2230631 [Aspergillus flavus]|uniref:Uncharacterized protein n=1 Tax=Aspergillus flavus (strain ATCC 200026 / FGSC A1120 / IAM 13836 / NRRL 3357 / JCM 12722 / SRRC 167) TaxID=332952 RepID=A0A7U2QV68_ASPFN|nr:hypothetical protein AFLA_006946 [Aspergillus flavus NRRL3357]QRD85724.1 hypothetical protein F9C07_2230631 [Aspergillus flavus]
MGRKAYFARLDDQAKERRRPRRQINGYVPGADKEEDAVRNKDKKLPKTKELHQQTLDLWFDFTADPENGFQHYKTVPGCLPLSYDMVKAFIRWYADSTNGRLDKSRKLIVRTTKACAERFFGGFREVTKTEVPETDRKEIYSISSRLSLF